jgi:hypothetical protein
LHVATVLTGHFLKQGDNLMVTLEAIDVRDNRLLWQSSFTAPAQDLIALQSNMAAQIRQGLLPTLGVTGGTVATGSRPKNPEAYDLYLHALALPHDPGPNKDAIAVLQHVVQMDPDYAPAWEELGLRAYWDTTYSDGGEPHVPAFQHSLRAGAGTGSQSHARCGQLITNRVERGELGKAYEAAQALVKRRPENAQAHFVLSYVYRYAGMLEEATKECNTAIGLDPANYIFRSCAWAFMELGKTDRAADFIRLDAGSEWAAYVAPSLLLREGKITGSARSGEAHADGASLSPRSCWNRVWGCDRRRSWTASPTTRRPVFPPIPIPRPGTTKERCLPTAEKRRPPPICCRAPSRIIIVRTPTC